MLGVGSRPRGLPRPEGEPKRSNANNVAVCPTNPSHSLEYLNSSHKVEALCEFNGSAENGAGSYRRSTNRLPDIVRSSVPDRKNLLLWSISMLILFSVVAFAILFFRINSELDSPANGRSKASIFLEYGVDFRAIPQTHGNDFCVCYFDKNSSPDALKFLLENDFNFFCLDNAGLNLNTSIVRDFPKRVIVRNSTLSKNQLADLINKAKVDLTLSSTTIVDDGQPIQLPHQHSLQEINFSGKLPGDVEKLFEIIGPLNSLRRIEIFEPINQADWDQLLTASKTITVDIYSDIPESINTQAVTVSHRLKIKGAPAYRVLATPKPPTVDTENPIDR